MTRTDERRQFERAEWLNVESSWVEVDAVDSTEAHVQVTGFQ